MEKIAKIEQKSKKMKEQKGNKNDEIQSDSTTLLMK